MLTLDEFEGMAAEEQLDAAAKIISDLVDRCNCDSKECTHAEARNFTEIYNYVTGR